MSSVKIEAGSKFPAIWVNDPEGNQVDISVPGVGADWRLLVIYRGRHCPLCTKYLNQLEIHVEALRQFSIDIVAVSADSQKQLTEHMEKLDVSFPIYYGLSIEQMQTLGLYISNPISEKETDHPFAEPGLFVINADGQAQLVDISNAPFVRPEIETLVKGLTWIRNPENNYPIRGTYI